MFDEVADCDETLNIIQTLFVLEVMIPKLIEGNMPLLWIWFLFWISYKSNKARQIASLQVITLFLSYLALSAYLMPQRAY